MDTEDVLSIAVVLVTVANLVSRGIQRRGAFFAWPAGAWRLLPAALLLTIFTCAGLRHFGVETQAFWWWIVPPGFTAWQLASIWHRHSKPAAEARSC